MFRWQRVLNLRKHLEDNKHKILEALKSKLKMNFQKWNRKFLEEIYFEIEPVVDAFLEMIPEHVISGHIPEKLYNRNFRFWKILSKSYFAP